MLTHLAQYDLLNLLGAGSWPEEKQASVVVRFTDALASYVGEKLSADVSEGVDEELKKLIATPDLTPEQVIEFYKTKIPNIEEKLDTMMLEFKKDFLLQVYEKKVETLTSANNPTLLSFWQTLVTHAKSDNWDEVNRMITTGPAA